MPALAPEGPLDVATGGAQPGASRAKRNPWNGTSNPNHRPGRGGGRPISRCNHHTSFAPSGARNANATDIHGFRSSRRAGTRFTRGYNPTPRLAG